MLPHLRVSHGLNLAQNVRSQSRARRSGNYGSAIEAGGLGPSAQCCCAVQCCPCCVGAHNRSKLTEKYNIDEPMLKSVCAHCCCSCCALVQDMNLILVKENKTWGCPFVEIGAPARPETMDR